MFNRERSKSENLEKEKSPEQIVNNAVSAIENKDATDSTVPSEWLSKAKSFTKTSKEIAGLSLFSLGLPLFICGKILYRVFEFAKKAIEKGGEIGFGEGSKIGEKIFSVDEKKDKK